MKIYKTLHDTYGPQGWWPFLDVGYHPLDYNYPKNESQIFEVCLGVILTQNTTFNSVTKSLCNLHAINCLSRKAIKKMPLERFKLAIKPSGYFNQKAGYILNFIDFFEKLSGRIPSRKELLEVKGIGPESADSILLYGYNQAEFVVDTYTKRLFIHQGLIVQNAKYETVKTFIQDEIKKEILDNKSLRICYNEFHALIVVHAKKFYSKKPYATECFI